MRMLSAGTDEVPEHPLRRERREHVARKIMHDPDHDDDGNQERMPHPEFQPALSWLEPDRLGKEGLLSLGESLDVQKSDFLFGRQRSQAESPILLIRVGRWHCAPDAEAMSPSLGTASPSPISVAASTS